MILPRVSVVMPIYNVEAFLDEAIQSVLSQSFKDFEVLLVDDGSTDSCPAICARYTDPRVRVVRQENRGLAGARNTGIAEARGEFIALLDSDDRWHTDKLMLHVIHLDSSPDVGVSFSGSRFIDKYGNPLRQSQNPKLSGISTSDILCFNPVGNGSAPVIRRAALDEIAYCRPEEPERICYFDESFRQSEDIELWLRMSLTTRYQFDGIEPLLTDYRIVPGGLSANVVRQFESWQRAIDKTNGYASSFIAKYGASARAHQLRYLARRSVQMGDGSFAFSLMMQAVRASPKMLWKEPKKTGTTIAAAILARMLPPASLARLARIWTGGRVVA